MHIHICKNSYIMKIAKFIKESANLRNALSCFLNIFFNDQMIRVNSPPCFFIRSNKILSLVNILISSVAACCPGDT